METELAVLQAFVDDDEAGPIPKKALQVGAAAIDEDENVATERVLLEGRADHPLEPEEAFSHVDRSAVGKDPPGLLEEIQVRMPRNRKMTP